MATAVHSVASIAPSSLFHTPCFLPFACAILFFQDRREGERKRKRNKIMIIIIRIFCFDEDDDDVVVADDDAGHGCEDVPHLLPCSSCPALLRPDFNIFDFVSALPSPLFLHRRLCSRLLLSAPLLQRLYSSSFPLSPGIRLLCFILYDQT